MYILYANPVDGVKVKPSLDYVVKVLPSIPPSKCFLLVKGAQTHAEA